MRRGIAVPLLLLLAGTVAAETAPRDVELTAPDGVKLKATYYAAARSGPGILLLHMCNSDRKAWARLAPRLAADGFHVLALDYRGYGESGGPSFDQITPQERQQTVAQKWPSDFDAAFAYLSAQPGVDKARMGAAGGSCGVNNAVQLARRHPEVKTLVLLAGDTNREGRAYLRQAAGLPILGVASYDDGDAVRGMEWLLGFATNPNNQMLRFQTGGHGTELLPVHKDLEPAITAWFGKHLRNASTRPPTEAAARSAPNQAKGKAGISPGEFWDMLETPAGAARALQVFDEAKKKDPQVFLFPEGEVNLLGYAVLPNNARHAIDVFKLNVAAYPDSANVYDSLADGYAAAGERDPAIEYSKKALEKLGTHPPPNPETADAIRQSAEQKLQRLRGSGPDAVRRAAPPPPIEQVWPMPIVYSVPGMDRAQVRSDVIYKTVDAPGGKLDLKMDVYLPADARAGQRFPAVVFISGGGADSPDWRKAGVYTSYGRLAAASGFVGITYQKRYPRGFDGIVTGAQDTADLIRYSREHAAELSIDPDRLASWAFSAGGLMLAGPLRERPPYIRAVLSFYAVADAGAFFPDDQRRRIREEGFSPLENVKRPGPLPALFVGRAGFDNADLNAGLDALVQEALRQNADLEVMNHPTGRHGFDVIDPDDRSRAIIARAVEFLKARLR